MQLFFYNVIIIAIHILLTTFIQIGFSDIITDNVEEISIDSNQYTQSFDAYDLHPQKVILPSFEYTKSIDEDSDDWWEVKYSNHKIFDPIRNYRLFLRKSEIDLTMIHSCYEYKVTHKLPYSESGSGNGQQSQQQQQQQEVLYESSSFCYPAIIITGVPKCSTSAMFALLSSPNFIIANPVKENCLFLSYNNILDYFASLPKSISPNHYQIDGCIDVVGNMMIRKLLRNPNTFYIVMVRNFADMIWSGYNYWCDPKEEERCDPGSKWADPAVHKRSPELFHEIILTDLNKNKTSKSSLVIPSRVSNPCTLASTIYQSYLNFVWSHVTKEATIVVASEQLDRNPTDVWYRIVEATGIPSSPEPNFKSFGKVRYNTQVQGERGADISIDVDTYTPGKYTISGNMPLLPVSKGLLDQCWHDDCMVISKLSYFQYNACKDKPTAESIPIIKSLEEESLLNQIRKKLQFSGYLRQRLKKCYDTYGNEPNLSILLSMSNITTKGTSNQFRHLRNNIDDSENTNSNSNEPIYSSQVLVITDKQDDRDYFRGLLRFALGVDAIYDTVQDHKRSWTKTVCATSIVIATEGSMIERVDLSKTSPYGRKIWFHIRGNGTYNPCPNRYFSRLLVTRDDVLSDAWKYFVKTYHFIGTSANWMEWDKNGINIVTNDTFSHILPSIDNDFFNDVRKEDILMVVTSHLVTGMKKFDILREILSFVYREDEDKEESTTSFAQSSQRNSISSAKIYRNKNANKNKNSNSNSNTMMMTVKTISPNKKYIMNFSHIACTFALAQSLYLNVQDYYEDRIAFSRAYSSKGLLCIIQSHFTSRNASNLISFPRPFQCSSRYDNSSRIQLLHPITYSYRTTTTSNNSNLNPIVLKTSMLQNVTSTMIDTWKCDTEYHRRYYIEGKIRHHAVVFIANSLIQSINARLLFEYTTGLHTGAVESNNALLSIFGGEFACGQRLGLIHMKWSGRADVQLTRGITPAVRLSLSGKRKCIKGMIRGFTRAIVLVQDPFLYIWDTYLKSHPMELVYGNNTTNRKNSGRKNSVTGIGTGNSMLIRTKGFNSMGWRKQALEIAGNFTDRNLNTDVVFSKMTTLFNETNVFAVSHEALIYLGDSSENTVNDRYDTLSKFIQFSGHGDRIETERLQCAYSVLSISDQLKYLDIMVTAYIRSEGLICEIKKIIDEILESRIFIHHMFASYPCNS